MAIKTINVGNVINDGSGDDLRSAFVKVNDNFSELFNRQGQDNTASNVGTGEGLFKEKFGVDLKFKTILAGDGITLTPNTNTLRINNDDHLLVGSINSVLTDQDFGPITQNNYDPDTLFLGWLKENIVIDMGTFANPKMTVGGSSSDKLVNGDYAVTLSSNGILLLPKTKDVDYSYITGYDNTYGINLYTNDQYYSEIILEPNGPVYISTHAETKTWAFRPDGKITFPDGSVQTTAYTAGVGGTGYTGSQGYWGSVGYRGSVGYWGSVGYTGSGSTVAGPQGYWGSVGYTGSSTRIPTGGTSGQVLTKSSSTDYDATWTTLSGYSGSGSVGYAGSQGYWGSVGYTGSATRIPTGGTTGQVLTKGSSTDYDATWTTPASGIPSRITATVTTTSLASGASATYNITGFKGYALYSISVTEGVWVTLYSSVAARTADSSRTITTDPTPGSGVIAECITTASGTQYFSPAVYGYSSESPPTTSIPIKVTNNIGGITTGTVITLTLVQTEA